MGTSFGKKDNSATNDVLNGQVVATGTPGAQTVRDPNAGLTPEQQRNRKLGATAGRGLMALSGAQDQQTGQPTVIDFANNQPQMPFYGSMGRY